MQATTCNDCHLERCLGSDKAFKSNTESFDEPSGLMLTLAALVLASWMTIAI